MRAATSTIPATFLPGDTKLTNRYTGLATAPIFTNPQWPGEIGVDLLADGFDPMNGCTEPSGCAPTGYRIIGRGRDAELIRIENVATVDPRAIAEFDSVLANCALVVEAGRCCSIRQPVSRRDQSPRFREPQLIRVRMRRHAVFTCEGAHQMKAAQPADRCELFDGDALGVTSGQVLANELHLVALAPGEAAARLGLTVAPKQQAHCRPPACLALEMQRFVFDTAMSLHQQPRDLGFGSAVKLHP